MFNSMICGSFHNQEDDDDESFRSCSSPKRSSRRSGSFKIKDHNKNPYSSRGLDKFDALLAKLDDKKQKIYTQKGAQGISLVRFVYLNDNKIKPVVVVKVKEKKQEKNNVVVTNNVVKLRKPEASEKHTVDEIEKRVCRSCDFKMEKLKQPFYYLPLITILILIFLAIFGKSFAILCTSLGWYMIPSIKGATNSSSSKLKKKKDLSRRLLSEKKLGGGVVNDGLLSKKEYSRGFSDKKISVSSDGSSSPTSVMNGPTDISPRKHCHRRSF